MKKSEVKAALILTASCLLVFWQVLGFEFLSWDDPANIMQNPGMNPPSLKNIIQFWLHPYNSLYIPVSYSFWAVLTWINLAWSSSQNELSSGLFHGANLVLHILNSFLVYRLILWLIEERDRGLSSSTNFSNKNEWISLMAALLFAVHPVQVQILGWVSSSRDLLSAFFSFICIRCFFSNSYEKRKSQKLRTPLTPLGKPLLAFLLALLSKPSAVSLPGILWVLNEWIFTGSNQLSQLSRKAFFKRIAPLVFISIVVIGITKTLQPDGRVNNWTPYFHRPWVALDALTFYFSKIIWPGTLVIDYGRSPSVLFENHFYFITSGVAALVLGASFRLRKRLPEVWIGLLLWITALFPVLGFIAFDFQRKSTVSDHYLYFPLFGILLGGALGLRRFVSRRVLTIGFILIAAQAIRSGFQILIWRSTFTLFSHTVEVNPKSFSSHLHLAAYYHIHKHYSEALRHYQTAIELEPSAMVYMNMALLYSEIQRLDLGIQSYKKALKLEPKNDLVMNALGELLFKGGQGGEALAYFEAAVLQNPSNRAANENLGNYFEAAGNFKAAIRYYEQALQFSPNEKLLQKVMHLKSL
jgi:protein O-mannosyl-transferase